MCTYSVMADYGKTRVNPDQWTRPVWNEFQEILQRLSDLDAKLDQPDCEDAGKAEWMASVEARLDELEKQKEVPIAETSDGQN